MKKLTAFLSAIVLGLTAAPATAFAESSAEPIAPEIQMGDVNGDGYIDASDATLTLRYYTLMRSNADIADIPNYDNIVKYGDVNGDGVIDCSDASVILRKYTESLIANTDCDVNRDGVADLTDACLILHCYTCLMAGDDTANIPYYDNVVKYGDMNNDGIITAVDASYFALFYKLRTGEELESVVACEYLKEKGII